MLKEFWVDLHIHTCLSPCGDSEMRPSAIVRTAKEKSLDIIGIADHNTAENVVPVKRCGEKERLKVIGGIEIASKEEVHIMGFFDEEDALAECQRIVYQNLAGENDENYFGEQILINEFDVIVGRSKRLLIGATSIGVGGIVKMIHGLGGGAIASHVDRQSFSISAQLGFVPQGLDLDALEISSLGPVKDFAGFPLVRFSDAHYLEDIGTRKTKFIMQDASIAEIRKALLKEDGRNVILG
jgi:PHP family Zn ribbon phosphoesterase